MITTIPFAQQLYALAFEEDLALGDATTDALPNGQHRIAAVGQARQGGVFSGREYGDGWIAYLNHQLRRPEDNALSLNWEIRPGQPFEAGQRLFTLSGPFQAVLKSERVLLNGLQHLCGVARLTHQYTQVLLGTGAQIAHTRKTLAGWRGFDQQAVVDGGGVRHRFNLGTAVMIKDNHVAAVGGDIVRAIQAVKQYNGHTTRIEVEVDSLDQLKRVLPESVDVVLLDNFTPEQIKEAVALIGDHAVIEASGGITLETAKAYGEAGAQVLSSSQLTLAAKPVDIGLDMAL